MPRPHPPVLLATLWLATTSLPSAAQDRGARIPGTLPKAYEALVGDGSPELSVVEPQAPTGRLDDPPRGAQPAPGDWILDSGAFGEQYGVLDAQAPGEFQVRRSGLGLGFHRVGSGGGMLGARFSLEASSFDFNENTAIGVDIAEPVQDLFLGRVSGYWHSDPTRRWAWSAGAAVEAAGEAKSDFSDTLTTQGYSTASYRLASDLALTVGAFARTALEDDLLLLPIVGVEWTIDDRSRVSTRGTSLNYEFDLDDRRRVFATFAFQSREYRLDGLGPASLSETGLSDRELRLFGGLEFRPGLHDLLGLTDSVARIYGGSTLYQELSWHSKAGDEVLALYQEPTLLLGVSLSLTF